jgi:putative hydrolase
MRRMQATMSLVEGYGNLVMSVLGRDLLRSFDRLDAAYRERSGQRGTMERLVWRLTGLGLKMEQYRTGESFARTVHDRYGMDVLNRAWEGPDLLPSAEELHDPDRWYRRTRSAGV